MPWLCLPLAIAVFNDSIICSSSGWKEWTSVRLFFTPSLWSSTDFLFLSSSSAPLGVSLTTPFDPTVARTPAGLSKLTFLLLGFLVGLGSGSAPYRGTFVNCGRLLVFEEGNFAARYIETLLFRLRKECSLVHWEFRIIDKGVRCVIVFHRSIPALFIETRS